MQAIFIHDRRNPFEKKISNEAKLNSKAFYKYANSNLKVKSGTSNLKKTIKEKRYRMTD